MSRSIVLPLLALGGIILYGTTRASQPAPETLMDRGASQAEIGLDRALFDEALAPRTPQPPPPPPPGPRLRSAEAAEAEAAAPGPEPSDSSAADAAGVSGGDASLTGGGSGAPTRDGDR